MNVLSRDKQIEVIAALCEGVGIRTASRLTGVNRGTVANLALRVGLGCMELHDRLFVGIRCDESAPVHSPSKNLENHVWPSRCTSSTTTCAASMKPCARCQAKAIGVADRAPSIAGLVDATLTVEPCQ